ncbi:MAG TPA: type II secretion system secretin GspD [Polyangiaceae bacterium]|jgi:general secretion pathway protein D
MRRTLLASLLATTALAFVASDAHTQPRTLPRPRPVAPANAPSPPPPSDPPAAPATPAPAVPGAAPGAPVTPGKPGAPAVAANGKQLGDTNGLAQFENGVEFQPRSPQYKVAFSLEDADLTELVRVISQLTGKRFIFGGKVRNIKATVYSPQKVTVAEAYQAFLAILETNGLTVVPHGRFLKIVETGGIATQDTPLYAAGQAAPAEERYITRMHRLQHVSAEEVATVLGHFKTKDGDITVYGPGNLLIITDTGSNIRRMMQLVEDIDVGGAGDQIWIEKINYASAADIASRINDLFEVKGGGGGGGGGKGGAPPAPAGGGGGPSANPGEMHVAKIVADDRSNSLVIVATERAYLRILELIKRLDVPQSGEGEIHVLALQHADATELTKTLNEIISGAAQAGAPAGGAAKGAAPEGIFEGRIKVSADKATNSLVVTSSMRDYAELRSVVDRLDMARRQVFIEAVIMDLTIARRNTWGANFHAGALSDFGGSNGDGLVYGGLNPLKTIGLPDPTSLQGAALGVRGPGIPGSETLLGTGVTIPAFGVLLNALAHSEDTDVLSTPHILATDNVAAEINVGNNIPLQTNAGAGLSGLAGAAGATGAAGALGGLGALGFGGGFAAPRQDVGTKIKVTPHLNESNEVRLELTEEISEASAAPPVGALGTISLVKRNAQTTLTVRDQQTVVIGGLMRNRVAHSEDKIPLLGDIPVLGVLFRSSSNELQKSNLILVLTPYIIREQADLRAVFERKMQERQEFLDRYFVFSEDQQYEPPHNWERANGLLEDIRQSYLNVEEQKALDDLTKPKEVKGHDPGQPLEIPAARPEGGGHAAPTPAPGTPPSMNINPGVRNVEGGPARAPDRVEK